MQMHWLEQHSWFAGGLIPQRWGLCCTASCPVLRQRVSYHVDSWRREGGHIVRRHPLAHLWGQTHREVIWWVWRSAQDLLIKLFLQFLEHQFLFFYAFRFHQSGKGWHCHLKRQRRWHQQVWSIFTPVVTEISQTWLLGVIASVFLSTGFPSLKHMIFLTPVTCPTKRATW